MAPFMVKEVLLDTFLSLPDGTIHCASFVTSMRELTRSLHLANLPTPSFQVVVATRDQQAGVRRLVRSRRFRAGEPYPPAVETEDARMHVQWNDTGDITSFALMLPSSCLSTLLLQSQTEHGSFHLI